MINYSNSHIDLYAHNLVKPYDKSTFIAQLTQTGIPQSSIDAISQTNDERRLLWLYEDIADDEVQIIAGERHSCIVGIFVTDGRFLLLERSTALGQLGEHYKMGGQIQLRGDPQQIACQEVNEETPLNTSYDQFLLLGTSDDINNTSPKLPGVVARKRMIFYKCYIPFLEELQRYSDGIFIGSDGYEHDLLLEPISEVLTDERVKTSYKETLKRFYSDIVKVE